MRRGIFHNYAYAWLTTGFFLVSIVLHWTFGWYAFADDAHQHGIVPEFHGWAVEMARDTFENWQSEFLQLIWQVVGLAYFLYLGSPASKENDDRMEAKIDALIRMHGGADGDRLVAELDSLYLRVHGHSQPHGHESDLARSAGRGLS